MTEAFASAVAVTVPILALAAGAEARGIRERLSRPDPVWEKTFKAYQAERELDMGKPPAEVIAYFKEMPPISKLYVARRVATVTGAIAWLAVFVLLALTELFDLGWLADGAPSGDTGLAVFSVVSVAVALAALIMAPAAYLLVPLLLPVDVIPEGLKKAVGPKLATAQGRGFMRLLFSELEGAVTRAAEKAADEPVPPQAGN